ncbi:DUF5684 domain-containing protein [Microbacterium sp. MYb62]|uniref:DUF5684 domain-containing protein n=1 Tax=Microbacterium sp. MYb62 TaxID=1848690 RepID=UPI000CFCA5D4|nr:DUF5684 domain-containing protein [Microbacterium sp. MYb62]PRB17300.1 hypothetical protein CQ042_05760 [Microbacterium sp. MYb62]
MTAPADTGLATMLFIVGGLGLLIGIAIYVWYAFALSRLFPRIDGEGWKGWVPVLNEAEILARGGVPAWSVVFYFIPLVQIYGLYLKVVATHRINKRFGHGAGMTVLAILLPPVWATVLAWGAAPYPEGERLAALQPGPRRSASPAAAPARDASGYTIPSLSPSGTAPAESPALVFPDYAPPRASEPEAAVAPPAPSAWGVPPQPVAGQPPVDAPARSFAPPAAQIPAPQLPAPQPPAPQLPAPQLPAPPPPAPQPSAVPPPAPQPVAPPQPVVAAPQESPAPGAPFVPPAAAPVPPAPGEAYPPTGIMAAMTGAVAIPPAGAVEQPLAPEPQAPQPLAPEPQAPEPPAPPLFVEVPSAHPSTSVFEPVPRPAPPTADSELAASVDEPQRAVRSVPPSFRDDGIHDAEPQMPTIRPAPDLSLGEPVDGEANASAPAPAQPVVPTPQVTPPAPQVAPPAPAAQPLAPVAPPAAPQGGLTPEVDATVVTPRPTDDDLDATVVVARKRGVRRVLVLDDGRRFALSGASVVIGRNPVGDPGEQRLAISDTTRTLSKTHARLVVQEDEWRLTDLHATNGVVVVADDGAEMLLDPGESVIGTGRFILGEVGMHVVAERDS